MNKFENPIEFDIKKKVGNREIVYSDLMEIAQGSPVIGNISINGERIIGRYGGPAFCKDEFVYIPAYVKKFLGMSFKLARINSISLEVEYLSKNKDLIFLDKIDNNRIYFFEDMDKTIENYYEL